MSGTVGDLFPDNIRRILEELDEYEPREAHNIGGDLDLDEGVDDPNRVIDKIREYEKRLEAYKMVSGEPFDIQNEESVVNIICNKLRTELIGFIREHTGSSISGCKIDIYLPVYETAVECKCGIGINKVQKGVGQCLSYEASYNFVDNSLLILGGEEDSSYRNEDVANILPICKRAGVGLAIIQHGNVYLYRGSFEHKLMGIWDYTML